MKKLLLWFIPFAPGFIACNKQNGNVLQPMPNLTKGSITGIVFPAKAVDSVITTNLQTNRAYSIKLDTTQSGFLKWQI